MEDIFFIQIGANIGPVSNDPLYNFIKKCGWKGILIEPVPNIFEQLKKNYEGYPGLYFENVAISNSKKIVPFYLVNELSERAKQIGGPLNQLGTMTPEIIFKTFPILKEEDIYSIEVPCVPLQEIIDKYKLKRVDLIHIDAEGQDAAILLSIDFQKIQPKILIFEYIHMNPNKYLECMIYLAQNGYSLVEKTHIDAIFAYDCYTATTLKV